jgi:hypothetical protein
LPPGTAQDVLHNKLAWSVTFSQTLHYSAAAAAAAAAAVTTAAAAVVLQVPLCDTIYLPALRSLQDDFSTSESLVNASIAGEHVQIQ